MGVSAHFSLLVSCKLPGLVQARFVQGLAPLWTGLTHPLPWTQSLKAGRCSKDTVIAKPLEPCKTFRTIVLLARSRFQSQFLKKNFPLRDPLWAQVGPKVAPRPPQGLAKMEFFLPHAFSRFSIGNLRKQEGFAHRTSSERPELYQRGLKV